MCKNSTMHYVSRILITKPAVFHPASTWLHLCLQFLTSSSTLLSPTHLVVLLWNSHFSFILISSKHSRLRADQLQLQLKTASSLCRFPHFAHYLAPLSLKIPPLANCMYLFINHIKMCVNNHVASQQW